MSKKIKYVKLTDEEQAEAGRNILKAALSALGDFPSDDEEYEIPHRVIRALASASAMRTSENNRLEGIKGSHTGVDVEVHQAVATAFWLWMNSDEIGLVDGEEFGIPAMSRVGARLIGLVQGISAAWISDRALDMLDDGSTLGYCDTGVRYLEKNHGPE